jgi:hypothetical protein
MDNSSSHTNKSFIGAGKPSSLAGKLWKYAKNGKNHAFLPPDGLRRAAGEQKETVGWMAGR